LLDLNQLALTISRDGNARRTVPKMVMAMMMFVGIMTVGMFIILHGCFRADLAASTDGAHDLAPSPVNR
jgi:multisubunit Na+/H+ antiporter MnhB subunit